MLINKTVFNYFLEKIVIVEIGVFVKLVVFPLLTPKIKYEFEKHCSLLKKKT
jgi:hypothetical protein